VGQERGLFSIQKKTYAQQYSQIYFVRLASLLPALQSQSRAKWTSSKGIVLLLYCVLYTHHCKCSGVCREDPGFAG